VSDSRRRVINAAQVTG